MALQHLRSSTANKRPLPAGMSDGQLAINTNLASPGLFFKDSNGDLVKAGPVHVGTTAPNASPAAGGQTGNTTGELWLDTSLTPNELKTWSGSAWVSATGQEIPVSKLIDGSARQLLQTDAAGTGVEWTSNVDVPGTLDVTSTATFDSIASHPLGTAGAPTITFTGDTNTGIYSPGADELAISSNGVGRLFIDASGYVKVSNGEISQTSATGYIRLDGGSGLGLGANIVAFGESHSSAPGQLSYGTTGSGAHIFNAGGAERMRLTSTGALGLGTSTPGGLFQAGANGGSVIIDNTISELSPPTSGNDSYIFRSNNDGSLNFSSRPGGGGQYRFWSGSSVRAIIDSSGRVGIGTTAGVSYRKLTVKNEGSAGGIAVTNTNDDIVGQFCGENIGTSQELGIYSLSNMRLYTGGTQRATIDASGRLLVGTSSVVGTGADNSYYALLTVKGAATSPSGQGQMALVRGESSTSITSGETIGRIVFADSDAGNYALIDCTADGTAGSGDYPGRLVFSTTADGASSPTERMRIKSNGAVSFFDGGSIRGEIRANAYYDPVNAAGIQIANSTGTGRSLCAVNGSGSLTDNYMNLGDPATRWGTVYAATGTINTSDANLKQDIEDLDSIELAVAQGVKSLIKKFRFKDALEKKGDNARIHVGVIAQEVEQVFVDAGLDPRRYALFCEDELKDGTKRLGIRYDELLAFVVAAL